MIEAKRHRPNINHPVGHFCASSNREIRQHIFKLQSFLLQWKMMFTIIEHRKLSSFSMSCDVHCSRLQRKDAYQWLLNATSTHRYLKIHSFHRYNYCISSLKCINGNSKAWNLSTEIQGSIGSLLSLSIKRYFIQISVQHTKCIAIISPHISVLQCQLTK